MRRTMVHSARPNLDVCGLGREGEERKNNRKRHRKLEIFRTMPALPVCCIWRCSRDAAIWRELQGLDSIEDEIAKEIRIYSLTVYWGILAYPKAIHGREEGEEGGERE